MPNEIYIGVLVGDMIADVYARDKLVLLVYGSKISTLFKQAIAKVLKREYIVILSFFDKLLS